ncbi:MAG: TolC family protein [Bacteroides sp.]|nr:TolC family protein [Bacteroides sp.]
MKKIYRLSLLLLTFVAGEGWAQESGISAILNQIEANNKELQADQQRITSQKLENKSDNTLPDPTVSYAHLWDSDNSGRTVGELVVSQSFEFPTLYISRGRQNRLMAEALDAQANAFRQQILLQAQELCLDIILLHRQQMLLDERLKNAEELARLYTKRLETGDANILETNKINLELLNVRTEARLNAASLTAALTQLQVLNGNQPLAPGRPGPDMQTPGAEVLGLTDFPVVPLPADFRPLCAELVAGDASLQALQSESQAARKALSINRQGWIPKLELGYKRNSEDGHPLNGVVVGVSLPLFENRHKVKIAKAEAATLEYQKENAQLAATATLWNLYEEAARLHTSIGEYEQTLEQQQDLTLLKQALEGGEISLIEYFLEVATVYQSKANLLQLQNRYQKAMAEIYKSRL